MSCEFRQDIPFWSPKLHALGVPSMWAAWILLLWRQTTIGTARPWSSGLPGPALCGGCWLLVDGLGHKAASCRTPGWGGVGPWSSAGSLVSRTGSWGSWLKSSRYLSTSVGLLVGGAKANTQGCLVTGPWGSWSWHQPADIQWSQIPGHLVEGPAGHVGQLVERARA